MKTKTILLLGMVGAGKGTQAKLLAEKTGYRTFSSGVYYRELSKQDTAVGRKTADLIDRGILMPEWFHEYVMQDVLFNLSSDEGIILDSVAKKLSEAKVFHRAMEWLGRDYVVLNFNLSEAIAQERLSKRYGEEGRQDDRSGSIPRRFEEYRAHTLPSIEYFRELGKVIDINADQTREAVHAEVLAKLE